VSLKDVPQSLAGGKGIAEGKKLDIKKKERRRDLFDGRGPLEYEQGREGASCDLERETHRGGLGKSAICSI